MHTRPDVREYAARLKRCNQRHYAAMQQRCAAARQEAQRLAETLAEQLPGIRAVYGFGSVFETNRPFGPQSDIDLAIDGGSQIEAVRLIRGSRFRVDIVDLSDQPADRAERIREDGVRLFPAD